MIPYIYYPSIDLDLDELALVVRSIDGKFITNDLELFRLTFRPSKDPDILLYQRRVSDYPYLTRLQEQIPILGPIFNIYIFTPNEVVPTHIDSNRLCALNIPLANTSGADTIFYDRISTDKLHETDRTLDMVDEGVELYKFNMDRTVVFNTTIPHKVVNRQPNYRITISWGFNCGFEEAVEFFESMRVL